MTKAVYDAQNAVADAGGIVAYVQAHSGASTLAGLSDVALSTLATGQSLVYNATTQKWINAQISYANISGKPTLGTAAAKNSTDTLSSGSTDLIESGAVHSAIEALTGQVTGISDEIADMLNILGAKNLLLNNATTQVINGVTFSVNSDGSIGTSGTSTDGIGNFIIGQITPQQSGEYILSGCDGGTDNTYFFNFDDGVTAHRQYDDEIQLSLVSGTTYTLRLWINASNVDMSGKTFYPMIRLASIADDTYVPYSKTNQQLTSTITALDNKHKVTLLSVNTSSWTADTTSQSGTTLYKKSIALNHVYVESPSVDIGASGVLPTTAQQTAYDLLEYVTCDSAVPCLYLYASAIPTDAFYINVEGVD